MPSVIQELAGEDVTLTYGHIQERIEDWQRRLVSLYADVASWLPGYTTSIQGTRSTPTI